MVNKTVADLNPKSQAVKSLEMTLVRALALIDAFDALEKGQDWIDVPATTYRRVLGNGHYAMRGMVAEVYKRWEGGLLYSEVLDLAANLPPAALKRKEIADGLRSINARLNSRGKGKPAGAPARGRRRKPA